MISNRKKCDVKFGTCVYCENFKTITKDHVPPKNLFKKPRPNNLITVPACHDCNKGASEDDEYFRTVMAFREDTYEHPEVKKLYEKTIRGLNRPTKNKFRKHLLENMNKAPYFTESGIYLGEKNIITVDMQRIRSVIHRTVCGLYYNETEEILPVDTKITVYDPNEIAKRSIDKIQELLKLVLPALEKCKLHDLGNKVFEYKYNIAHDNSAGSIWFLRFYKSAIFIVLTT